MSPIAGAFVLEVVLEELESGWRSSSATVAAVLDDRADRDRWAVGRRVGAEPRLVEQQRGSVAREADDLLGRARLAGDGYREVAEDRGRRAVRRRAWRRRARSGSPRSPSGRRRCPRPAAAGATWTTVGAAFWLPVCSMAETTCGVTTLPPLPTSAKKRAICSGVTATSFCPIVSWIESPGFQSLSISFVYVASRHSGVGRIPCVLRADVDTRRGRRCRSGSPRPGAGAPARAAGHRTSSPGGRSTCRTRPRPPPTSPSAG